MNELLDSQINELTIKKFIEKPNTDKYKSWNTSKWVHCKCTCGNEVDVPLIGVTKGLIKSCGHLRKDKAAETLEKIRKDNPTPTAVYLTYNGKTMNVSQWSNETAIPRTTILYRIANNMPIEKILERKEHDNDE